MDINEVKRLRNRIYQKAYYKRNKNYHILYNLRKRLVTNINEQMMHIINIREYAKLKKNEVEKIRKKEKNDGLTKITAAPGQKILVYFD